MGRLPSIDGSPTSTITLRLPTWALDRAEDEASLANIPVREWLRGVVITQLLAGREVRDVTPGAK